MAKTLQQKVEAIIDTGEGSTRQVIVRARPQHSASRTVFEAASRAIRERSFVRSAREILPSGAAGLRRAATELTREQLAANPASLFSQRVQHSSANVSMAQMRDSGHQAIDTLYRLPPMSKAAERSSTAIQKLWIAGSLLVTLDKDDLAALSAETETIVDIDPNNTVRLPDYARTSALPANINDNKTSAYGLQAVGALSSWGAYGERGGGVRVAVLDTGVDATHPDLSEKLAAFAEFDVNGNQVPGASPHDSHEHGTHVAGTVLGGNASGQWIGVAPEAALLAGLVLPNGSGTDAQIIAGMQWALENGADVINMSLGGLTFGAEAPSFYTEVIVNALLAGVPVVTAIGNDGEQTTGAPANDLLAFSVGATDFEDQTTGFSGGRTHVLVESDVIDPEFLPIVYMKPEISAPGYAVHSSIPGNAWANFNGTSMATPHVAGAIALLLSNTSIRDQVEGLDKAFLIQDLLMGTTEELGERGQDQRYGFGRLDVLRAIGEAHDQGFARYPGVG